jgi:hypothetical protein
MESLRPSPALTVRIVSTLLVFVGALLPWLTIAADPAGTTGMAEHSGLQAGLHFRGLVLVPLVVTALVFVVHRPSGAWSRMVGTVAGVGSVLLVGFYWLENVGSTFSPGLGMVVTLLGGALLVVVTVRPDLIALVWGRLGRPE